MPVFLPAVLILDCYIVSSPTILSLAACHLLLRAVELLL